MRALLLAIFCVLVGDRFSVGADEGGAVASTSLQEMTMVTFNIRWPSDEDGPNRWEERKGVFMDVLRELDPDVMGVQEAFAFQLEEICETFPDLRYVGVARDDGKEEGEFSALFYRADRFSCLDSGTFWLSDTPDVIGSNTWEAACNRVCTWARLRDEATQQELLVYNAHLDHESATAREKSMPLIERKLRGERNGADLPVVVMGDFNAGPDSAPLRFWLGDAGSLGGEEAKSSVKLENSLRHEEDGKQATFHGWKGHIEGRQIDYILLSEPFELKASAIVRTERDGQFPSDHYPVMARVALPSPVESR